MARLAVWLLMATIGLAIAAALAMAVSQHPSTLGENGSTPLSRRQKPAPAQQANLNAKAKTAEEVVPPKGDLERLDPRAPLSGMAAPAPPPTAPDPDKLPKRWRLVHQPVATAAGILETGGMTLVLPGIDVVAVNETCISPSGTAWPCGMAARTAFRAYLRGRALNCHLPDASPESGIVAECLLQGEDPSLWLVSQGWARATAGGPLLAMGQAAELARLGIFGQPPR